MNKKQWSNRISQRSDFTCGLVHLTKPQNGQKSLDILINILKEGTLKASTEGYICGKDPVVCFQDVPLQSLAENILYEQQLRKEDASQPIRYAPFGLRFSKPYIYRAGGRPVIYENTGIAKSFLLESEYWRIVKFDLNNDDNFIDWTHEREWRIKGDLHFDLKQVEILLSKEYTIAKFVDICERNDITQILKEVKGITMLKSIVF